MSFNLMLYIMWYIFGYFLIESIDPNIVIDTFPSSDVIVRLKQKWIPFLNNWAHDVIGKRGL